MCPWSTPVTPTTSEISLVWERRSAASIAGFVGNPARSANIVTSRTVTTIATSASTSASSSCAAVGGCASAHSAVKKTAVKKSPSGACHSYSGEERAHHGQAPQPRPQRQERAKERERCQEG